MEATYKNPWHKENGTQGPLFYTTSAHPIEHASHLIYERIKGRVWDVVKDGVCVHQRAGLSGAIQAAEAALQPQ